MDYSTTASSFDELADGVLAVLGAENVQRLHVVGQSAGGMLAEVLSRRMPDRIRTMALSGAGLYGSEDVPRLERKLSAIESAPWEETRTATAKALRAAWQDAEEADFWIEVVGHCCVVSSCRLQCDTAVEPQAGIFWRCLGNSYVWVLLVIGAGPGLRALAFQPLHDKQSNWPITSTRQKLTRDAIIWSHRGTFTYVSGRIQDRCEQGKYAHMMPLLSGRYGRWSVRVDCGKCCPETGIANLVLDILNVGLCLSRGLSDMPMRPDEEPIGQSPIMPPESPNRTIPLGTPMSLQVRADQVDEVVRLFRDNAKQLADLIREGEHKLQMPPMAKDEVSGTAARGFTMAGVVHIEAVSKYREWLRGIADDLEASARNYRATDGASAVNLGGTDSG
ncbi:WXG100 family type VII secretion target [Kibdelosporangium aridum]|nr:PE domain-containing protein [Kibdelosporangium aridum]